MENKSYQLRYLPMFETDLLSTVNYITNVLKNEDAAIRLVDDIESVVGTKAPEVCPVYNHPQSYFEVHEENY